MIKSILKGENYYEEVQKEDSDSGENYSNPVLEHYECDGQIDIFYYLSSSSNANKNEIQAV